MKTFLGGLLLTILLFSGTGRAQVTSGDSLALVSLYNSTNGSSWTTNTNWLSASAVSTWFGVTVTGNRVSGINLSSNNLTGTLPTDIASLSNLTQLQLFDNQLTGSIPSQLGNLLNLVTLGLENNQFTGTIPASLGNLTIATSITLGNNQLTDSVPVSFNNLSSLEQLEVQNNRLDVFPDLSGIASLTSLKLEGNKFTFEDIEPNIGVASLTYAPQDSVGTYSSASFAEGSSQSLAVSVGGSNNQYQWTKNGTNIALATSSTYAMNPVQTSDAGTYSCDITNSVVTGLTLKRRTTSVTVTGTAPGAPTSLAATAVSTSQINLAWTASTGIPVRYQILRSLSAGSGFVQIDSVAVPTITYSNTGLSSKTIYFYQVRAVGNFGVSASSNTANDTTLNAAPTRALAILDTTLVQDYHKTFHRVLRHVFTDPDDVTLNYTVTTNSAQIVGSISNDSLYTSGGPGFIGSGAVIVGASDGVSSVADTFSVTIVADTEDPVISVLNVPSSTTQGTAATVSCTVTDNGGIASVLLFYRSGAGSYDSVAMNFSTGTFSAQTPGSAATIGGVSVYVVAKDNAGNPAFSDTVSIAVNFTTISSTLAGSAYPGGIPSQRWRLFSVPADLDNKTIGALFPNISSAQYVVYNGDPTPSEVTTLLPGQAVWMYQNSGVDLPIATGTGQTNDATAFQVTLAPGEWTLVGAPFTFSVAATTTAEYSGPWSYGGTGNEIGGWSRVTSMQPFGGYAFFNKTAGNLTFTMTPSGITTGKTPVVQADERTSIALSVEGEKDGWFYPDRWNFLKVVGSSDAHALDDVEPETPGDNVSICFQRKGDRLSVIHLTETDEGVTADFVVRSTMSNIDVHLTIEQKLIDEGRVVAVYDVGSNKFVENSLSIPIHFDRKGERQFRLIVGTPAYLQNLKRAVNELPTTFALEQNYPNPFNPSTSIPFALAEESRVTLSIYNLLGQRVRTLISNTKKPVGNHREIWDGRDASGQRLASGIYIYRLEALTIGGKKYVQNRKMILVK